MTTNFSMTVGTMKSYVAFLLIWKFESVMFHKWSLVDFDPVSLKTALNPKFSATNVTPIELSSRVYDIMSD